MIDSWQYIKLENICEINLGKTPSRKNHEYWGVGSSWLTISDLKDKYINNSRQQITNTAVSECKCKLVKKGTLLMSFKLSIGKLAFTQKDIYTNEAIVALPIKQGVRVCKEYLYFVLKYIPLVGGNQAAMGKTLNKKSLSALMIPIPSTLTEQKRIVKLLSSCDNLIQRRKESINLLDEFIRSTFLKMFGDPVRNDKGWDIVPLIKMGDIDRGISKHRPRNAPELLNGNYPLIQTGDVSNSGTYIMGYSQTYSDIGLKQSKMWSAGTLCITIAANIAKTSILTFDACFPDSVVGFVVDSKEATNLYVHHLFSFFQQILEKNAPSAAQKNINLRILRSFKVPQPPINIMNQFDNIALKIEHMKIFYFKSLKELEDLYESVNQQVFKGELDLSKVDISEIEEIIMSHDHYIKLESEEKETIKDYEVYLDKIIKHDFDDKLFSVQDVQKSINNRALNIDNINVKNFLRKRLSGNIIEQVFNDDLNQIMFRLKR